MSLARQQEAEKRIAADEWDLESWQTLCACAGASSYRVGATIYERLQRQFPTAGKFWRAAAEHARRENIPAEEIIAVYEKGVENAGLSVELWASYAQFLKEIHGDVAQVLEKAFTVCGLDLNVHVLWNEYIDYVEATTSQPEQKTDALRTIYQRAVRLAHSSPFCLLCKQHLYTLCFQKMFTCSLLCSPPHQRPKKHTQSYICTRKHPSYKSLLHTDHGFHSHRKGIV